MRTFAAVVAAVALAATSATHAAAGQPPSAAHEPGLLPIVFVHGQSGSAQQLETQAMRFTSNGYPRDLLFAFEYDTGQSTNPLADLDAFADGVLDETGAEQVYAIGHSRGTTVWTSYLTGAGGIDGSPKVAKYVNIDGDVLVDNAGIVGDASAPIETRPTDFLACFGVNLLDRRPRRPDRASSTTPAPCPGDFAGRPGPTRPL